MQLREGGVLVESLVAVVLGHPPGKPVREADQQRSSERICGLPTCSSTSYLTYPAACQETSSAGPHSVCLTGIQPVQPSEAGCMQPHIIQAGRACALSNDV